MREGETIRPSPGERITCIESSSGGGRFVFELELAPGVGGPPIHTHDEGDETIEVLEGEIDFKVHGKWRRLGPGDSLTLTPSDPHTFRNPSREHPVRCNVIHGARFEKLMAQPDLSRLAIYLTDVDPGASRTSSAFMRLVLRVMSAFAKLRGLRVDHPAQAA